MAFFLRYPWKFRAESEPKRQGESMAEQAKTVLIEPEQRRALPEYSWEELNEPGTYVEKETGNLYRIPKALIQEASPLIRRASLRSSTLVQLSKNPFMTTFIARITCAEHNVKSNF
jgi:hypothetical protein